MRVHYKPGDNRRRGDQSSFFCIGPLIISRFYFSSILLEPMRHVILDTDIGTDVDDLLALVFLAHARELPLKGVTTG